MMVATGIIRRICPPFLKPPADGGENDFHSGGNPNILSEYFWNYYSYSCAEVLETAEGRRRLFLPLNLRILLMPSLSRGGETASVQSPPRKRFKFSLKLKAKNKGRGKIESKTNTIHNNKEEIGDWKEKDGTEISANSRDLTTNDPSSDTESDIPLPYAGLANLGNTCYVNAVLQVLRYCPKFLKSLEDLDDISSQERPGEMPIDEDVTILRPSIINSVHKLAYKMTNAEKNYQNLGMEADDVKNQSGCTTLAVYPREFVEDFSGLRPMFGGYEQHDAQEFLRALLCLVEEDCIDKDDDKGNMEEKTIQSNTCTSDLKVKGGSKYPHYKSGDIIETVAESTSMKLTSESEINHVDCCEDQKNRRTPAGNKTSKSLSKDLNCPKCAVPNNMNLVKRLFEGTLQLQTCCLNCEGVRQKYENFQDISVPIQNSKQAMSNIEDVSAILSDSEDESKTNLNLSWAISKFASVERLQGENKYFCDSCATLTEAEISTYFEKLPQVLTIHLKRFQTCYGQSIYLNSWITKVTRSLHTPQELSLDEWCSKTCHEKTAVYRLFGVVMHSGISSCSGHYLSYVNVQLLNEQEDSGLMEDAACSCQDRNPEQLDETADEVEEKPDSSIRWPKAEGIAKYFQILRKYKASTQTSANNTCHISKEHIDCHDSTPSQCTMPATCVELQTHKMDEQDDMCDNTEVKFVAHGSSKPKWLKFDDAEVHEISEKEIEKVLSPSTSCYSTPYLLFYFRS